jgi:hypothetical protein
MNLFIAALMVHLIADFFLQNDWMADNKSNVKHSAGYIHASIHTCGLMLVFPAPVAFTIGALHWFIDLRFPLAWWGKLYGQTTDPVLRHYIPFAMWRDQAAHIAILCAAVLVMK